MHISYRALKKSENVSRSVVSDFLQPHGLYTARLLCPWNSPGKNTGVDYHPLLQGIFQTQRSNLSLLHCRLILYHPSHQGSCKNTGAGSYSLLWRIFPIQVSNLGLLHCRQILSPSEPPRKPKNIGMHSHSLLQGIFPMKMHISYRALSICI